MARKPKTGTDELPSALPLMTRADFEIAKRLFSERDYLIILQEEIGALGPESVVIDLNGERYGRPLNHEIVGIGIEGCINRVDSALLSLGVRPIYTPIDSDGGADEAPSTADSSAPHPSWEGSDQPQADPGAGAATDPDPTTDPDPAAAAA